MTPRSARAPTAQTVIVGGAIRAIAANLVWRWLGPTAANAPVRMAYRPLLLALAFDGGWLVLGLFARLSRGEFRSDLLTASSIDTSAVLGEELVWAFYSPFAVATALAMWAASGDPVRFLAVPVVANPYPLSRSRPSRPAENPLRGAASLNRSRKRRRRAG